MNDFKDRLLPIEKYQRRSIRLADYDYSGAGAYFVTICTHNRESLFGQIVDGAMVLNDMGRIVAEEITKTEKNRENVNIDKYGIMPNHVHIIIVISDAGANGGLSEIQVKQVGAIHELPLRDRKSRRKMILPKIIGRIKMNSSKRINILRHTPGNSIWQRNYYEHVIRNEYELNRIRRYIINNPPKWEYDQENRNGITIDEKKQFWSRFLNEW